MSICTKTGDKGDTSLYTGQRVPKASPRVESYGTVDEINSALGLAKVSAHKKEVIDTIEFLQKLNMSLMADLSRIDIPTYITEKEVSSVEAIISSIEKKLPPINSFIMPGNTLCGAFLDLARTISRRAERRVLALAQTESVDAQDRIYLNRLSDLCFLLMRLEETNE